MTVAPAAILPVSNCFEPPVEVTVCVAGSALRTVTFAPGATTSVDGPKAKFRITMVFGALVPPAVRWEEPQPATPPIETVAAKASVADRLRRTGLRKWCVGPNT